MEKKGNTMSKGKLDDDEVVFRDLNGNVDDGSDYDDDEDEKDTGDKSDEYEIVGDDEEEDDTEEAEDESDDEPEEAEEDESEDESLKAYSPKIRDRIERERKLKREAVDSAAQETKKLREEIRQMTTDKLNAEFSSVRAIGKSCDYDIAQAKRDLIAAKEDGETAKEVDAQTELNRLQSIKSQIDNEASRIERVIETNKAAPRDEKPSASNNGTLTAEARAWVDRNQAVFTKGGDKLKNFVYAIDKTIDADPNTPEYFDKMNRLIKTQFPELAPKPSREVVVKKKALGEGKKKSRVAGVGADSTMTSQRTNPNKVKIDKNDIRIMKTFGMDPTNKAHLAQYAREKRAL